MSKDPFLEELETRLAENRRMVQNSWIPQPFHGAASYMGFHSFRILFVTSFGLVLLAFYFFYDSLMALSRALFWLP